MYGLHSADSSWFICVYNIKNGCCVETQIISVGGRASESDVFSIIATDISSCTPTTGRRESNPRGQEAIEASRPFAALGRSSSRRSASGECCISTNAACCLTVTLVWGFEGVSPPRKSPVAQRQSCEPLDCSVGTQYETVDEGMAIQRMGQRQSIADEGALVRQLSVTSSLIEPRVARPGGDETTERLPTVVCRTNPSRADSRAFSTDSSRRTIGVTGCRLPFAVQ